MVSFPSSKIDISIVIPCYNEELNIVKLLNSLMEVLNNINMIYEIICVNDGSQDNTLEKLIEFHENNPSIKIINLSRNFGKEIALTAGIDYTIGAAVIPIDADLQDPPELIYELVKKWRQGYDVIYAIRNNRQGESWFKKSTAKIFYHLIGKLSVTPIPPNTGDFRLLDRRVVNVLKTMRERNRFMKGLFAWVGFKQDSVTFDRPPRYKGSTKLTYYKLWNLAIDGIISFSLVPLKIWSYIGFLISLASLSYACFLVIRTLILGIDVPGYASLIVAILFLGGIQLISLGILGEYLGRVYEEVKNRPLYLVREVYGSFEN